MIDVSTNTAVTIWVSIILAGYQLRWAIDAWRKPGRP